MKKLLTTLLLLKSFELYTCEKRNPHDHRPAPLQQINPTIPGKKDPISPKNDACDKCVTATNCLICCVPRCCYYAYLLCCEN